MVKVWTEQEEAFLDKNYKKFTAKELQHELFVGFGRQITESAIIGKIQRMGYNKGRRSGYTRTIARNKEIKSTVTITHTKTMGESDNSTCMFTTDEPKKGSDMGICGKQVHKGRYCKECCSIVYRQRLR